MPKVLITNGSNPITWYHKQEGKVFPVTCIKNRHYHVPDQGELGPYGVHFPDGELLYTEAEFEDMRQRCIKACDEREVAKNAGQLACNEAQKFEKKLSALEQAHEKQMGIWKKQIDELLKENHRLKDEFEAAREGRKVKLPREVAETIEFQRSKGHSNYSIIDNFARERTGSWVVDKWSRGKVELILQAIVNDYTIEETGEDKIVHHYKKSLSSGNNQRASDIRTTVEILGHSQLIDRLDAVDAEFST